MNPPVFPPSDPNLFTELDRKQMFAAIVQSIEGRSIQEELAMLIVRDVFQAKYGRGDELVVLFKELAGYWAQGEHTVALRRFRILTDASGPFFTVVTEIEIESFTEWPQLMTEEFALPQFADWFARMVPLVESGRREFYNVVERWP